MDKAFGSPFIPTTNQNLKYNLLIGVTGSVAAIKLSVLVKQLSPLFNIKIILTQYAKKFMQNQQNQLQSFKNLLHEDHMEWQQWKKRGDPVLHIQLRKWAHFLLIAPLSANTLAKLSNGICDNLLTLVCRAWPISKKNSHNKSLNELQNPIVICPSMNTMMWEHPITQNQINILKGWGYQVLGPINKKMMCGDVGIGAMCQVQDIVKYMKQKILIKEEYTN